MKAAGDISTTVPATRRRTGVFMAARRPLHHARTVRARIDAAQVITDSHLVLRVITNGTLLLVAMLAFLLTMSFFLGNHYVLPRVIIALGILLYAVATVLFVRKKRIRTATAMVMAFYALLGTTILIVWGVNVPMGLLLLGFVIALAGTLLRASLIIPVTGGLIGILILVQVAVDAGFVHPDTRSLALPSSFLDVGSYCVIFVVVAVISWLTGRRMEQSLARAQDAEADLQAEKDLLEVRLDERTRSLRDAQLEEMRQLYRFAELGQLGTIILHDLSNNLTALTLDMDDIEKQTKRSDAVERARESITYLDSVVVQARRQLKLSDKPVSFDAVALTSETVTGMKTKAARRRVRLVVGKSGDIEHIVLGDPLRFAQVITILVTNAIDAVAHDTPVKEQAVVTIGLKKEDGVLVLTVTDPGAGIDSLHLPFLFQPFHSTKPNGMGIGLFIAHEIVTHHFHGSIAHDRIDEATIFTVSIPEPS